MTKKEKIEKLSSGKVIYTPKNQSSIYNYNPSKKKKKK